LPATKPGTLLRARQVVGPKGFTTWQILYLSQTATGQPVAVSGLVARQAGLGAVGEHLPVISWAHGTTGLGDQCAPSHQLVGGFAAESAIIPTVGSMGAVFVGADYEGLGTPGEHPYLLGQSEGRDVLDIVRAAQHLDGSGVDPEARVVIWGHSQGGGAAAFAGELAPTYAPDLHVVGTIAGAPAGELPLVASQARQGSGLGFELMLDSGLLAAYPDLPVDAVLTPQGRATVDTIRTQCIGDIMSTVAGHPAGYYLRADPTTVPAWEARLEENNPGRTATSVPLFIYHGDADTTVPPIISQLMFQSYCALGVTVQRTVYPGKDHISVIGAALDDIESWAADRIAGERAPSNCPPR
jgi:pimeloyl-ACP methyl ester carboxylesterase